MKTNVTFRHFKGQHPGLHTMALEAAEQLGKYNQAIISTDVEFINDENKIVEFTVFVQGKTLKVSESSDDFKKSLGIAHDKIKRQIKKHKSKLIEH